MRLPRLTYANVVATVALFLALGGSAIAVSGLIKGKEIKRRSIPANRIKPNALGGGQIDESKLGEVPKAGDAAKLGGADAADFERYGQPLASGRTMAGQFAANQYDFSSTATGGGAFVLAGVSFPRPAPAGLTDAEVNFAPGHEASTFNADEDPSCAGTPNQPTAPAGRVCLYIINEDNVAPQSLQGFVAGPSSRFGFTVQGTGVATGSSFGRIQVLGTWAYTAP